MSQPLVTVENLQTYFYTDDGVVRAVDDVSFVIPKGKTLGLVGESGSGKSVTAMSIIRLIASPGRIAGGRVMLHDDGQADGALASCRKPRCARSAAAEISMIFQEPMTSLNPVFTIGHQISEAIIAAPEGEQGRRPARSASRCCARCAFPSRSGASTNIRTSSPAACGSGR